VRNRGQRVERYRDRGRGELACGQQEQAVVADQHDVGGRRQMLDDRDRLPGVEHGDHCVAVYRPLDQASGQEGGRQRARHEGPAQFLEDDDGVCQAQAHAAVLLGERQAEDPHLG
jgi:hypothetical protein